VGLFYNAPEPTWVRMDDKANGYVHFLRCDLDLKCV